MDHVLEDPFEVGWALVVVDAAGGGGGGAGDDDGGGGGHSAKLVALSGL